MAPSAAPVAPPYATRPGGAAVAPHAPWRGGSGGAGSSRVQANKLTMGSGPVRGLDASRPVHGPASAVIAADGGADAHAHLVSLDAALPRAYRAALPYASLNRVQSRVFDALFNGDASVAVAAPTGCGKTAIFELAIVRLLMQRDGLVAPPASRSAAGGGGGGGCAGDDAAAVSTAVAAGGKVVYLAPLKALCAERKEDWVRKFGGVGARGSGGARPLRVVCVTGDDDVGGGGAEPAGSATGAARDGNDDDGDGGDTVGGAASWTTSAQEAVRSVSAMA